MNIVKLNGEDDELYRRVARLVMDKDVLASNNNYPFKTSASHIWFVAYDENDTTTGFIPVAVRNRNATINNYYIANNDIDVFGKLLDTTITNLHPKFTILSVTQRQHISTFRKYGFTTIFEWEKYVKMIYNVDSTKERL